MATQNILVPVIDAEAAPRLLIKSKVWTGPLGTGTYLPNPDDLIVDYSTNTFERVLSTDYTNFTYTSEPFIPVGVENEDGVLNGLAPTATDSYRIYIDDSTHPATLLIDGRMTVSGADYDGVRIFRGTDISETGEVISGYRINGTVKSDVIPLTLASVVGNKTVKVPLAGICTKDVENGDVCTLVFYTADSNVGVIRRASIIKTNLVMAMESPALQVLSVTLKSPYISKDDSTVLEIPINLPFADIPLSAEVKYSNGKTNTLTVGSGRASLKGLPNAGATDSAMITSTSGIKIPLMLSYRLSSNESYVGEMAGNTINVPYTAVTTTADGAYSVKLFVVPRWLDVDNGYHLDYYLCDLDRGNVYDASAAVSLGENSANYDPTGYGYVQKLIVKVDLSKISTTYVTHTHAQSFNLVLNQAGNASGDSYEIEYLPNSPSYGENIEAFYKYSNANYWLLDISCKAESKAEWLERLYSRLYPLYDVKSEEAAPEPTHVYVTVGSKVYPISVDNWMDAINIDFSISSGQTVLLKWVQRTAHDELVLAIGSMIAHEVAPT